MVYLVVGLAVATWFARALPELRAFTDANLGMAAFFLLGWPVALVILGGIKLLRWPARLAQLDAEERARDAAAMLDRPAEPGA